MAKRKHNTYQIAVKMKTWIGWGDWVLNLDGQWLGIDNMKNQVDMIRKAFKTDVKIAVYKDGKYLDYNGNETKGAVIYESK